MRFAYVASHAPTAEQTALAAEQGIELVPIGNPDSFRIRAEFVQAAGTFGGVVADGLDARFRTKRLMDAGYKVGYFQNELVGYENGELSRPRYVATALSVFGS